jgi:hypothetical protein
MSHADRNRRWEVRKKAGLVVLHPAVQLGPLADQLREDKFGLGEWDTENPAEVTRALERMLRVYSGQDASPESGDP